VAQVISKLVNITWPHTIYLGQKDFQQFLIISKALEQILGPKPKVVMVPTMRETDGLAMSSRNVRLSEEDKTKAAMIYATLQKAEEYVGKLEPTALGKWVEEALERVPGMTVDYAVVADMQQLEPLETWTNSDGAMLLVAVRLGGIRLLIMWC
jgi:pantoate--beta-alanine ligase